MDERRIFLNLHGCGDTRHEIVQIMNKVRETIHNVNININAQNALPKSDRSPITFGSRQMQFTMQRTNG